MEWLERMNAVIDYIEANLAGDIDITEVAEIAYCSTYHLQRIFLAVFGVSVADYIRRRRLTLAAQELLSGKAKVVDIAFKYGYSSPDSFTRAFRKFHSVTPQAARESAVQLVAFPRLRFHIMLTGGEDVDYSIVEKPAFEVLVKTTKRESVIYDNYVIDPATWEGFWWDFWEEFYSGDEEETLKTLAGSRTGKITGGSYLGVTKIGNGADDFSYGVGIEKTGETIPEGFSVVSVPASVWAVFVSTGPVPKTIHDLEDRVFKEWFPSTGYEYNAAPELEVFLPGDRKSETYRCEVWMPVVKK